jgi:hypothetical protein
MQYVACRPPGQPGWKLVHANDSYEVYQRGIEHWFMSLSPEPRSRDVVCPIMHPDYDDEENRRFLEKCIIWLSEHEVVYPPGYDPEATPCAQAGGTSAEQAGHPASDPPQEP